MTCKHHVASSYLTHLRAIVLSLSAVPFVASAQTVAEDKGATDARTLDTVEVVGRPRPLSEFPGAVSVIDGDTLRDGQRQVSLSESLARVPGITVLDRQNYAQDLQIQSRGFGARSTFGIRGIKLIVDGIPSSAADGQGQAGNFSLSSLDRIEVLRGPLALQYGNAAGGAIVASTDLDGASGVALDGWLASDDAYRAALRIDGASANEVWRWRVQGSRFETEGERPQSAAERSQFNAVGQWSPRAGESVRAVLNALSQPQTQDPLGLTRAQWRRDPHGTDRAALTFDTRKSIENHQLGLRWQREYAAGREFWLGGYGIQRDVVQFLALPIGAQIPSSNSGGVIDLGRRSSGIDAGHRWSGADGGVAIGIEAGQLDETRRGHENFVGSVLGVRGRLRRDEDNRVRNREVYLIGDWHPADHWTLLGAVRHTRIAFASDDHFIAPGNADDSGRFDYSETAASFGIARAFANGEVFASIGRGFETPTITELAYRPDGAAGFNRSLIPAHVVSAEVGTRWRFASVEASIAAYRIDGDDEIVPALSRGGRASFANAGRTRRDGIEASLAGTLGSQWSYSLAANAIRARFVEAFSFLVATGAQTASRTVAAGNRIPGIPRADGFGELVWHDRSDRFVAALEARVSDRIATDDRNSDSAPGYARFSARLEWRGAASGWHGFARIDNLFDRDYVGSVIVNEGNERFFEPGAGRSFTLGLGWRQPR
ncbi:MAG: TonB-dependent receptor [Lysobacter sp.]|nr:TonB-dependent receptor [Lysobacter sp.]